MGRRRRKTSQADNLAPGCESAIEPTLMPLEDRIVLDAAAIVDGHALLADATEPELPDASTADTDSQPAEAAPAADDAGGGHPAPIAGDAPVLPVAVHRVLLIASDVPDAADLAAAAGDGVAVVRYDADHATFADLLAAIDAHRQNAALESVALAAHGTQPGAIRLSATITCDHASLETADQQAFWQALASRLKADGRIDLLGCHSGAGDAGAALVARLEVLSGVNVAASDDVTANPAHGGDWQLETDGLDAAVVYFDSDRLTAFSGSLAGPPTITDTGATPTVTGSHGPTAVEPGLVITDGAGGDGQLTGATVRIESDTFSAGEDFLGYDSALASAHGISANVDNANGQLRFSGLATIADYQALLRSVTYENTSTTPTAGARNIFFQLGDTVAGYVYSPNTGHYYQLVVANVDWNTANANASSASLAGLQGYLVTVNDVSETALLGPVVSSIGGAPFPPRTAWIGGSDVGENGNWSWRTGPESGTTFWSGGSPVAGEYTNWEVGNPSSATGVDYTVMTQAGGWQSATTSRGFLIEYGGMLGDAEGGVGTRVSLNVEAPNHAPVLDGGASFGFDSVLEDATGHSGMTVASLLGSAGSDAVTDYNADPEGIAVTALDTVHGAWSYSLDGGTTWLDVGAVSETNALLLGANDRLRFEPSTDWNGTIGNAVQFKAWDQTSGAAGTYTSTAVTGGESAFSTTSGTAGISVLSVNDAPTLDTGVPITMPDIAEDALNGAGVAVSTLLGTAAHDVDGDPLGVAVVAADDAHGEWEYSRDGGVTWQSIQSPTGADALLLAGSDRIRFEPNADFNGDLTGALQLRAWDATSGTAGDTLNAATNGGSSALSAESVAVALAVTNVNDAPLLEGVVEDVSVEELASIDVAIDPALFSDIDPDDTLTYTARLDDGRALPNWLLFDGQNLTFRGRPPTGSAGVFDIRLIATDAAGATASTVFTLVVRAPLVTDPPIDDVRPTKPTDPPRDDGGTNDGGGLVSDDGGTGEESRDDAPERGGGDDVGESDDAADAPEANEPAPAAEPQNTADASNDAQTTSDAAGGDAGDASATGGTNAGMTGNDVAITQQSVHAARHEEELDVLPLDATELSTQIRDAVLHTESLISDSAQPEAFRTTWNTILESYAGSSAELAAYLQSAFRIVGEAAFMYQKAASAEEALLSELEAAAEVGLDVDVTTELEHFNAARAIVTQASEELEAALATAAASGGTQEFDQVLEDVITAALQRLMDANGGLFAESQVLIALREVIQEARLEEAARLDSDVVSAAAADARAEARATVAEMRKTWDRVAEDVFAAFVKRLATQQRDGLFGPDQLNSQID